MTDSSGPSQFPEKPRIAGQDIPFQREAQKAAVERVPTPLHHLKTPARIDGIVLKANSDGTVRVSTDQGEIDLAIQKPAQGQPPVKDGQAVEIILQPGDPPREASLRPVPAKPDPAQASSTKTQSSAPRDTAVTTRAQQPAASPEEHLAPRTLETPVSVELGAPAKPVPAATPIPLPAEPEAAILETGTVVRLLPLPPATVENLAAPVQNENLRLPLQVFDSSLKSTPDIQLQTPLILSLPIQRQPIETPLEIFISAQKIVSLPSALPALPQNIPSVQLSPPHSANIISGAPPPVVVNTSETQKPALPLPLQSSSLRLVATPSPLAAFFTPKPGDIPVFTPQLSVPSAVPVSPETQVPQAPVLRTGKLDVRIDRIVPPSTPFSAPRAAQEKPAVLLSNLHAAASPALVAGHIRTETGQTLPVVSLFLPDAPFPRNFALQFADRTLSPGTLIGMIPQTQAVATPAPTLAPLSLLPEDLLRPAPWPVLEDAYQILAQAAPAAAHAMAQAMPSPANPAQFGPAALFFIAALRAGDLPGWMGARALDTVRNAGRDGTAGRLDAEGGALGKLMSQPVSGDWRGFALPLFWQGEIHKMAVHFRHDEGQREDPGNKGGQTRFIFDLNLSRMGDVQLDGLLRGKKLDLIVRSQQPFSQAMQADMRRAYINALEQTDLSGELSFQNKPDQWVRILPGSKALGVTA